MDNINKRIATYRRLRVYCDQVGLLGDHSIYVVHGVDTIGLGLSALRLVSVDPVLDNVDGYPLAVEIEVLNPAWQVPDLLEDKHKACYEWLVSIEKKVG